MARLAPFPPPPPPLLLFALLLLLTFCPRCSAVPTSVVNVSCSLTFAAFDGANNTAGGNYLNWDTVAWWSVPLPTITNQMVVCPTNCAAPSNTSTRPAVFGSFPYSPTSSICAAAVHAGIVSNTAGGGVLVSRFYRHDWSNTTNQTVYPFDSWRGSASNGVQSGDVDSSSYRVPAGSRDWSYVVRGRGDFVV